METETENRRMDTAYGEEGEGEMYVESNMETYVSIYKIDSQRECAVCLRELKQGLCNNLEGWAGQGDGGERTYIYLWLIHVDVWKKQTKFCKTIILQLK